MKRIFYIIIFIVSLFIIKSLVTSIYTLWHKQDLIIQAKKDLEAEKKRNEELKNRLSLVQSERFIEEEARNKLFLSKPNEQEIIIPKNLLKITDSQDTKPPKEEPNWKKWLELFF